MTESVQTTYEEATRCPQCGNPGEARKIQPSTAIRGAKIHHIYCVSQLCPWYNTPWIVQVNADGSVPPKQDHKGSPKNYIGFEGHDQIARDILAQLEAQNKLELKKGGSEIRNPRG